jgi:hypothetical protein
VSILKKESLAAGKAVFSSLGISHVRHASGLSKCKDIIITDSEGP